MSLEARRCWLRLIFSFEVSVYSSLTKFVMKTLAYLDCPTGISGDMCLGALVHVGVPLSYLETQLSKLGISEEFQLSAKTVQRNQQAATKVSVTLEAKAKSHSAHTQKAHGHSHHHHHSHDAQSHSHHHDPSHRNPSHHDSLHHDPVHGGRRLPEIEALIQQADLPIKAANWSLAVFRLLAQAEASVHGIPPEKVHFHEVGATDAIVDIVGTCLGLDWLDIDELVCSALPTGGGTVKCEHGLLPVPAPAVLSMMATAQIPVYSNGIEKELVTPTGCAIAATLASSFGPPPNFTLQKVGLGAGGRDLALPNILRLWIGTQHDAHSAQRAITSSPSAPSPQPKTEQIVELQTQIDDCSAQAIAHTYDLLFAAGAVDIFSQAIAMKKNRLGTLLSVICPQGAVSACENVLFMETTTLGIRRIVQERTALLREIVEVETDYGKIDIKVARAQEGGAILNVQPEYEHCAKAAKMHRVSFLQVQRSAVAVAMSTIETSSASRSTNMFTMNTPTV